MNSTIRQAIFWVVIIVGAILLYRFFQNPAGNQPVQLSYSELVEKVEARQVATAVIEKDRINGKLVSQAGYTTKLGNEFVARDIADEMKKKLEAAKTRLAREARQ